MAKTLQELYDYIQTEPEIRSLINETVKYLKAAWPPEGSTVQTILNAEVTLTDDQIKNLQNTPVQIVPAPGVGKIIMLIQASLKWDVSHGAYTNVDTGATVELGYGDFDFDTSNSTLMPTDTVNKINITGLYSKKTADSDYNETAVTPLVENVDNKPLNVYAYSHFGDVNPFTGGDPANSLQVTVLYAIVEP